MSITQITNLIPLSQIQAPASELEPLPMARVENRAIADDEKYTPSDGKSSEDSEDNAEAGESSEAESAVETQSTDAGAEGSNGENAISFFA